MLFDTHCHLNFKDFENNFDEIIQESRQLGMFLNIVGCDYLSSKKAVEIAEKYKNGIFASIGIHPTDNSDINDFDKLKNLMPNNKIIAIGETGLDYYRFKNDSEKEFQKNLFIKHIDLAIKTKKPLIIHCRDAHKDAIKILSGYKNKIQAVLHCFTGNLEEAEQYIKLGYFLSFTGIITFTNQYDEIIKNIPLEKIMIETDAPFLAPMPFRGQINKPIYVKYVAEKIAKIKNKNFNEIAEITTKNAKNFFCLI